MTREYILQSPIHDIPNYPTLFIRDGDVIFAVNKYTGEISDRLTTSQYCAVWTKERHTNPDFIKYYERGLFFPKPTPDTAKNLKELKQLCSDKSRTGRGDTGYVLDFMMLDSCTITEGKLLKALCSLVEIWNYSVFKWDDLKLCMDVEQKQLKRVYNSLLAKGLIQELSKKFEAEDHWCYLVKIHPKLYWKGRYSAFINAITEAYEYRPDITM